MATDQPAPTVLLIVDPDGWLHEVPRELFTKWCELKGIARPDNLLRACSNRAEKGGYHFSNETVDRRGQWQPLHKLVFLRRVDKRLNPIPTCARACRPDPCHHASRVSWLAEPGFMACRLALSTAAAARASPRVSLCALTVSLPRTMLPARRCCP